MRRPESRISQLERSHRQTADRSAGYYDQDNGAIPGSIYIILASRVYQPEQLILCREKIVQFALSRYIDISARHEGRVAPIVVG